MKLRLLLLGDCMGKAKAAAYILIVLVAIAIYVLIPIDVYSKKLSGTVTGTGKILEDTFDVPPFKQVLRIRIAGNITGYLNVTIIDPTTNLGILSEAFTGYKSSIYEDRMVGIFHTHTYKIIVEASGSYDIAIKLTVYPY